MFIAAAFAGASIFRTNADLDEALFVAPFLMVPFFILGGLIGLPAERGRARLAAWWRGLWAARWQR